MRALRSLALLALAGLASIALAQTPTATQLKDGFGADVLEGIGRFDYRLSVSDAQGRTLRDGEYVLLPQTRRLYVRDLLDAAHPQLWSGGDNDNWRLLGTQWEFLATDAAAPYRRQLAYHFVPLLRDPATRYDTLAADRVRITPAGAPSFEVGLDAQGRIVENRFDGGDVARELDYRSVGGLQWPMVFEVVESGTTTRRGRFSNVAIAASGALPAMMVGADTRSLPAPVADSARLVGAGWISGARNDYNLSLDAGERRLVFARSQAEFEHAQIWTAQRAGVDSAWSEPAPVPFTDPRFSDSDPWLTPDGRTLYFVSNRPVQGDAARKDLDIWRVAVDDGRFGTPEHVAAVASDGQELGPEVHGGWLYFNSTRTGGPARMSIYRARLGDTGIGIPQPLGAPFNDGHVQGDFTLSPDGRTALFWSIRDGSDEPDLFAVRRDGEGWSPAVRLPSPINAVGLDFTPSYSADGRTLRLASMRKPTWLDQTDHVFNGQANVYVVPTGPVEQALAATR